MKKDRVAEKEPLFLFVNTPWMTYGPLIVGRSRGWRKSDGENETVE